MDNVRLGDLVHFPPRFVDSEAQIAPFKAEKVVFFKVSNGFKLGTLR